MCELSAEERSSISDLSPFMSIGALWRILRNMWPNLSFDADLLYRLKAKAKQKVFGADKDAINAFMRKGKEIMDESGIFEITFEENMKIETVLIQTSAMRAYANQYDDFTILDGTFSISMYDVVLMIFSNVDCLLKTTMTGYVLAPSERSDITIHAAKRFSLDKEGTVLITDQASSFTTAALNIKFICFVCIISVQQCSLLMLECLKKNVTAFFKVATVSSFMYSRVSMHLTRSIMERDLILQSSQQLANF